MPSLVDHIDRFTYTAQAIQSSSQDTTTIRPTPYVRAILKTPLGDLARDVDASELGLFTLVSTTPAHQSTVEEHSSPTPPQPSALTRTEFVGATPLRKPAGAPRHTRREDEKDPEVYAEAALKYLDRYHSIRPMPRARQEVVTIIERLSTLRSEIAQLNKFASQDTNVGTSSSSSTSTTQDEEKRIQELTMRIRQMRARRDVLAKRQKKGSIPPALRATDKDEDAFWSESPAPVMKGRKARKSLLITNLARGAEGPDDSLLLDARMDVDMGAMLNEVSMSSIAGVQPTPLQTMASKYRSIDESVKLELKTRKPERKDPALIPLPTRSPTPSLPPSPTPLYETTKKAIPTTLGADTTFDDSISEADQTIVLTKLPQATASSELESESPRAATPVNRPSTPPQVPETPGAATPGPSVTATPGTARKGRVKVTTDIERIVARIWATVGEIIMPGHPFNTAAAATTNKPPRAKETIALLQNLSSQRPPPTSPTVSISTFSIATTNTGPGAQAILTAIFLLALFDKPPNYSMPLSAAKAVLAEANKPPPGLDPATAIMNTGTFGVGDKALETRALYGCVAKRLIKIERNGREQIVRFDV